jgi:hypothetical protein
MGVGYNGRCMVCGKEKRKERERERERGELY